MLKRKSRYEEYGRTRKVEEEENKRGRDAQRVDHLTDASCNPRRQ